MSDMAWNAGSGLPGEDVIASCIERAVKQDVQGERGIQAGDDPEWETAVQRAEWRMKLFLGDVIRHNGFRLFDEVVTAYKAAAEDEYQIRLEDYAQMAAGAAYRGEKFTLKPPKLNGTGSDVKDFRTNLLADAKMITLGQSFDQLKTMWGLGEHVSTDGQGIARIHKGDYLMADGRRYMEIKEDGSITTFNGDGSIRRSETLTKLMRSTFNYTAASRTSYKLYEQSVRFY